MNPDDMKEGDDHRPSYWMSNDCLPLACIDLDKFDANVVYVARLAQEAGKSIRLGSKSIRCVELMRRIFAAVPDVYRGILTFTVEETA